LSVCVRELAAAASGGSCLVFAENMNTVPKAETVKLFREATGMGWMASKLFFAGRSPELCERILRAHQEQGSQTLHDPIEDDPQFKEAIVRAREEAERDHRGWIVQHNQELLDEGHAKEIRDWPLGSCHRIWKLMKEPLKKVGISWYSPGEMNPGHHFD
jgi:hypothetical protein